MIESGLKVNSSEVAVSEAIELNLEGVKSLAATMAKSVSLGEAHMTSITAEN